MIPLFVWDDSFQTQIQTVDQQHRRLVDMINALGQMLVNGDQLDQNIFSQTRDGILEYAQVHFASEEGLMRSAGIDSRHMQPHLAEHQVFLHEALALKDLGDRVGLDTARKLAEFLIHWLSYHILEVDQLMGRQYHAIQAGMSPAQAFEAEPGTGRPKSDPFLTAMTSLFMLVSERNHELQLLNHELGWRVQERTRELSEANARLETLIVQDELTGLYNRRYASIVLDRLWQERNRYGGGLSILMIDADHFKFVNDQHGHAVGDQVLRALADYLKGSVRRSDIVCRYGGDEFLVICPRNTYEGAARLAKKILTGSRPVFGGDTEYWNGSISIGLAEADANMYSCENLLQAADKALYQAKHSGGRTIA
jgi:diguanylate cyclase (GGDEF)-like protein/hemerythrin-like metal-binding protein